jgi:hypothetical protein
VAVSSECSAGVRAPRGGTVMDFGIVEIISLLMGLQGFGLQADPKAPTPDASLAYAIPDADFVGHLDIASIVPGNYRVLQQLPDQPAIKASPELAKMVRKAINEIEGPRGMAKGMIGLDPVTDVNDATVFLQVVPKHEPNFIVIAHGKFSTAMIDKIASLSHKQALRDGAAEWVDPGDGPSIGVTKDGVLIAGTSQLVKERIAASWRAPSHGRNTTLAYAAEVIARKPVFALVMTMSRSARAEALKHMNHQKMNFASDLISRHKAASFSVYTDGIGWQWVDTRASGLEAMASISDGLVDLFRAAQIAPRGFAKILIGGLDSYRGANRQIDAVIQHKSEIMKIVDTYTGDGTFKVKIDKNPRTLKLDVRLTGRSASDVLPFGVVLPMGVIGFLEFSRASKAPSPMEMPMPAHPIAPPPPPMKHR